MTGFAEWGGGWRGGKANAEDKREFMALLEVWRGRSY
jgi:hypothetical protein